MQEYKVVWQTDAHTIYITSLWMDSNPEDMSPLMWISLAAICEGFKSSEVTSIIQDYTLGGVFTCDNFKQITVED